MKQGIRIFFLFMSLVSGGYIYHEQITVGYGLISIFIGVPCFIISSLIAVFITTKTKIHFAHKRLGGFIVWITSITILICILTALNKMRNFSPILFSTSIHYEDGLDIEFRKNGTYKALNHNIVASHLKYGEYELQDSLILIEDKLRFGSSNMKDTLVAKKTGLLFTLEKPYGEINEKIMSYKYIQETKIIIENNTNINLDSISIKLSYPKEFVDLISLKAHNRINYNFYTKNAYVDGKYILTYKFTDELSKFSEIRNLTNRYPLEAVKSIRFEESEIVIELIFGKAIRKKYK